ncbi:helix-turn-helix transcriptional regulator [Actinokineospora pegani]|uniref:helix-turn-helix transcriptional regulator n=1 Tax=Actinokineospora pegani TaxID=2654637 RepID=UPI0012EA3840|nr:helix-turn-helix transcriptional regulator [Actinokineospora pegani]
MLDDPGVDALVRQWTAERAQDAEAVEASRIASEWLADAPTTTARPLPGIPGQRGGKDARWASVETADPRYLTAMRERLPEVPEELLAAAASWWQMVGGVAEAEEWWDAGLSPLDQRALDYRAAGLAPSDLARRLGPLTVLDHLRRGSAPAWCVARLQRQRRDGAA